MSGVDGQQVARIGPRASVWLHRVKVRRARSATAGRPRRRRPRRYVGSRSRSARPAAGAGGAASRLTGVALAGAGRPRSFPATGPADRRGRRWHQCRREQHDEQHPDPADACGPPGVGGGPGPSRGARTRVCPRGRAVEHLRRGRQPRRAPALAGVEPVDLVYIDPPYNTGNDFAYHDDFRDGARRSRHQAWVAMMRPRLEAAREVLARDRRDLRQHRRQRGGAPAAADGRGVRRAELPRPDRGQPQPQGPPARAGLRDQPRVPARLRPRRAPVRARREQPRDRRRSATSRWSTPTGAATGTCRCATPTRSSTRSPRATLHFPVWGDPRQRPGARPRRSRARSRSRRSSATARRRCGGGAGPLIDERPDDLVCRLSRAATASGSTCSRRTGCTATAGAGARSCARSGWPRRSAPPTPRSPS